MPKLLQDICTELVKKGGYPYGKIINVRLLNDAGSYSYTVRYRKGLKYFLLRYLPFLARGEKRTASDMIKGRIILHLVEFENKYFIYYPGQLGESIVLPLSIGVIDYDETDSEGEGHEGVPLYLQEKSHSSIARNKKK